MVGQFLAGVIVGVLIGLALAPVFRSWVLWQMTKTWREGSGSPVRDRTNTSARIVR